MKVKYLDARIWGIKLAAMQVCPLGSLLAEIKVYLAGIEKIFMKNTLQ